MTLFIEQCLNGLQFGLLLFLLAAGLTLVFGIMDLVNLAHGSLYMLGAYFAAMEPFKATPDDNADLSAKGKQAAAGRRCASCHGDNFAGTKAVPRLAGQREDYLTKTLHDYKSSARNGGPQGVMSDVAYPLSDEDLKRMHGNDERIPIASFNKGVAVLARIVAEFASRR